MRTLFVRTWMASCIVLCAATASVAQAPAENPQVASAKAFYSYMKGNVLKTAEKVPPTRYAYRATPKVRTIGQLLAHIADAQFAFCGIVKDGKPTVMNVEKTAKTKADIRKALDDSFALCDADWASLTDANSADIVQFRGPVTKLSLMSFDTAHGLEHYGNLVTYMRLLNIVPPSAEEAPKPAGTPAKPPAKAPAKPAAKSGQ
jgi:uncharacterized damage-inducible protein DinB